MIVSLLLLLMMTAVAAYIVKKKSKSQIRKESLNVDISLKDIDRLIEPTEEYMVKQPAIQETPKKKRKYNKKKYPKKMDSNKK